MQKLPTINLEISKFNYSVSVKVNALKVLFVPFSKLKRPL